MALCLILYIDCSSTAFDLMLFQHLSLGGICMGKTFLGCSQLTAEVSQMDGEVSCDHFHSQAKALWFKTGFCVPLRLTLL